jgi:hypothetical protein
MTPKILYHTAPKQFRSSIELNGLDPHHDMTGYGAVYLSRTPLDGEGDHDVWRVLTSGLDVTDDESTPGFEGDWFMTHKVIPPKNLELLDSEDIQYIPLNEDDFYWTPNDAVRMASIQVQELPGSDSGVDTRIRAYDDKTGEELGELLYTVYDSASELQQMLGDYDYVTGPYLHSDRDGPCVYVDWFYTDESVRGSYAALALLRMLAEVPLPVYADVVNPRLEKFLRRRGSKIAGSRITSYGSVDPGVPYGDSDPGSSVFAQWIHLAADVRELAAKAYDQIMARPDVAAIYDLAEQYHQAFRTKKNQVSEAFNNWQSRGADKMLPQAQIPMGGLDPRKFGAAVLALAESGQDQFPDDFNYETISEDQINRFVAIHNADVLANQIQYALTRIRNTYPAGYKLMPNAVKTLKTWAKQAERMEGEGTDVQWNRKPGEHVGDIYGQAGQLLNELRQLNKVPEGMDVNRMNFEEVQDWLYNYREENSQGGYKTNDVVFELPNNWKIVRITDKDDLANEGELMGHCVGGYCNVVYSGSSLIYSLRDPKNEPHVTIEIQGQQTGGVKDIDGQRWNADGYAPPLTRTEDAWEIVQIQGKSNRDPIPEYQEMIRQWFESLQSQGVELRHAHDYNDHEIDDINSLVTWYDYSKRGQPLNTEVDEYGIPSHTLVGDISEIVEQMVEYLCMDRRDRYRNYHYDVDEVVGGLNELLNQGLVTRDQYTRAYDAGRDTLVSKFDRFIEQNYEFLYNNVYYRWQSEMETRPWTQEENDDEENVPDFHEWQEENEETYMEWYQEEEAEAFREYFGDADRFLQELLPGQPSQSPQESYQSKVATAFPEPYASKPWNDPTWIKERSQYHSPYGDDVDPHFMSMPLLVTPEGKWWLGRPGQSHSYEEQVGYGETALGLEDTDWDERNKMQGGVNVVGNEFQVHLPTTGASLSPQDLQAIQTQALESADEIRKDEWSSMHSNLMQGETEQPYGEYHAAEKAEPAPGYRMYVEGPSGPQVIPVTPEMVQNGHPYGYHHEQQGWPREMSGNPRYPQYMREMPVNYPHAFIAPDGHVFDVMTGRSPYKDYDQRSAWYDQERKRIEQAATQMVKLTMADRSGHPELDAVIEEFLKTPMGDWITDQDPIEALRDPELAHGMCDAVTEQFVEFAKAHGLKAYVTQTDLDEIGYKPSIEPFGEVGFDENDEMQYGFYPEHTVATVVLNDPAHPYGREFYIDFTAAQYGYSDHPKVTSSAGREPAWWNDPPSPAWMQLSLFAPKICCRAAYQFSSIAITRQSSLSALPVSII